MRQPADYSGKEAGGTVSGLLRTRDPDGCLVSSSRHWRGIRKHFQGTWNLVFTYLSLNEHRMWLKMGGRKVERGGGEKFKLNSQHQKEYTFSLTFLNLKIKKKFFPNAYYLKNMRIKILGLFFPLMAKNIWFYGSESAVGKARWISESHESFWLWASPKTIRINL